MKLVVSRTSLCSILRWTQRVLLSSAAAVFCCLVFIPADARIFQNRRAPGPTLVTCYPFYFVGSAPERFIVRAERVGNIS